MSASMAARARGKAPAKTEAHGAAQPRPRRWLRELHLHGLDHLDAVLLAALASEASLLLIGPHGSAKSALLERVAHALALEHRHYNASLVAFDDLLGFPVPNAARDGLDYLRTPATLWGAQSVFLDEISRCRPDVQNKLFSIVHERRVSGVALDALRFRWAAMNPPAAFDADGELDDAYVGAQPLDAALADRFVFVVSLPAFGELAPEDRRAVIARGDAVPREEPGVARLVDAARAHAAIAEAADDAWAVEYCAAAADVLAHAKIALSGRRAAMLRRALHAVHGARAALAAGVDPGPDGEGRGGASGVAALRSAPAGTAPPICAPALEDSALLALRWCLPQRALGRAPAESTLLAAHRKALELAGAPADSPGRRIAAEPDPLGRVAIALSLPSGSLTKTAFSALVADAFAAQDVPGRYLLARRLLAPLAERDAVNAPTLEMLAEPMGRLLDFEHEPSHRVDLSRAGVARYNVLLAQIARLDAKVPAQASLANLLYTLFAVENAAFDPAEVVARDARFARVLDGAVAGAARRHEVSA